MAAKAAKQGKETGEEVTPKTLQRDIEAKVCYPYCRQKIHLTTAHVKVSGEMNVLSVVEIVHVVKPPFREVDVFAISNGVSDVFRVF